MRKFEINEPVKLTKSDVVDVAFVLDIKRFLFITLYAVRYYKRLYNYSDNEECVRWMTS